MCNAYDIGGKTGSFSGQLKARALEQLVTLPRRLVRRTDQAPVMLDSGELVQMSWGFRRARLGVINNSRSDKLMGGMWKTAFEHRRCLIPVSGYYEWTGPKGHKQTYRFVREDGQCFWMAGLWEESSEFGLCFSMITTAANRRVEPIHHRMPAVLEETEWDDYLSGKMESFSPRERAISYDQCVNPLRKNPPHEEQGELF